MKENFLQDKGRLAPALVFLGLLGLSLWFPFYSQDSWFYLKQGAVLWAAKGFPAHDLFGMGCGACPWPKSAWLFSLGSFGLYSLGGVGALMAAKMLAAALAFALLLRLSLKRGAAFDAALLFAALALLATRLLWTERPQALSFLFFAAGLAVLEWAPGRARATALFALTALWANVHDTSVFFVEFVGLLQVARWAILRRESLPASLGAPLAAFLGGLCNPAFAGGYLRVFQWYRGAHFRAYIHEWQPATWDEHRVFFILLALALVILARDFRNRESRPEFAVLGFLGLMSLNSMRFVPFAAMAAAAWTPGRLALSPPGGLRLALLGSLLGLACLGVTRNPEFGKWGIAGGMFPEAAAGYLEAHPAATLACTPRDGDYLLWRLGPRSKVLIDSRLDLVYPPSRIAENAALYQAQPGWEGILRRWHPEAVVVPLHPGAPPLAFRLLADQGHWRLIFFDDTSLVFAPLALAQGRGYPGLDPLEAALRRPSHPLRLALAARLASQARDAKGWYLYGQACQAEGDRAAAKAAYLAALAIDPGQNAVRAALATCIEPRP